MAGQGALPAGKDTSAGPAPRSPSAIQGGQPGDGPEATAQRGSATASGPALPAQVQVGQFQTLHTEQGDVEVLHAPASVRRALVYLHGACGDIRAAKAFADALQRYATLIALRGELSCGASGRSYWRARPEPLMRRIESALEEVARARSGLLDTAEVVLFGYSQGAQVAQLLTERWPERFPEVILGGVPSTPSVPALSKARGVALIGGSRELLTPMRGGLWLLEHNQVRAQLFVLKGAPHGSFGATPNEDLTRVLSWLLS